MFYSKAAFICICTQKNLENEPGFNSIQQGKVGIPSEDSAVREYLYRRKLKSKSRGRDGSPYTDCKSCVLVSLVFTPKSQCFLATMSHQNGDND